MSVMSTSTLFKEVWELKGTSLVRIADTQCGYKNTSVSPYNGCFCDSILPCPSVPNTELIESKKGIVTCRIPSCYHGSSMNIGWCEGNLQTYRFSNCESIIRKYIYRLQYTISEFHVCDQDSLQFNSVSRFTVQMSSC